MSASGRLAAFIGVSVFFLAPRPAAADTVYLTNGNQVEGVVRSQSASEVEVDIGYGTVTLQKAHVARIRRSNKGQADAAGKEVERRQFESGLRVPAKAGRLNELFQAAKDQRDKAREAKAGQEALKESAGDAKAELGDLRERRQGVLRQLGQMKPQTDPDRYNRLVVESNTLLSKITTDELALRGSAQNEEEGDPASSAYAESLRRLEEYLKSDEGAGLAKSATGWEADYYAWVGDEVRRMRLDFSRDSIRSEDRGPHILVSASINGTVTARLMVDTGATLTILNRNIADQLHLPAAATAGTVKLSLADGHTEDAPTVRLDTMAIGNSKVDGALAALPASPVPGCDGLLGMSFLQHFQFRIDSVSGTLILEALK